MNVKVLDLVFLFIILIGFPKKEMIAGIIRSTFGGDFIRKMRNVIWI